MQNEESVTPASTTLQENLQNLFGALSFFSLILLVIVLPFASILLLFLAATAITAWHLRPWRIGCSLSIADWWFHVAACSISARVPAEALCLDNLAFNAGQG